MRILLDTSAYSAFVRGHEGAGRVVRQAEEILLSAVVAGELMSGFRWGANFDTNAAGLRQFLEHPRVRLVPVSLTTADRYGRIYAMLRRKGRPIPTNDMWVAAQAMETGAELVSLDAHFEAIEALAWIDLR